MSVSQSVCLSMCLPVAEVGVVWHSNWQYHLGPFSLHPFALSSLLSVWSLLSGSHLYNFTGHQDSVLGVSLADEGNLVITGCRDSSLHIWDLLSSPPLGNRQHENITTSVSISPCGTYGVSGGGDSKLKLYDLENASIIGEIDTGASWVTRVLVLRDSERILVACRDGSMHLWNGVTQELLVRFRGYEAAAINCIAVSQDSSLVMSGGEDCLVAFWSAKSGARLKAFRNHSTAVVGVAFAQYCMLSASRDGQVCVRDFKTATILLTSTTHTEELLCLAASTNAGFFATGSRDKTCHVVDLETGQLRRILKGHRGFITCVQVLSNCIQCLTASQDGCLRIWDVEDGGCLAELRTDAPLTSCDISWKRDHILYGTYGGWVSSVVYKAKEKARNLILRRTQSSSDLSTTLSETVTSAMETSQKHRNADSKDRVDEDCLEVSKQQQQQLNKAEKTEYVNHIDVKVEVISRGSTKQESHPSKYIETHKATILHEEATPASKERGALLETSEEEEQTKVTSSACLIL